MTTSSQDAEIEQIKRMLAANLGRSYRNIQFFKEGGTRTLFTAEKIVGDIVVEKVVLKVDKKEQDSPRAQRHVARGYNTRNELEALASIVQSTQNQSPDSFFIAPLRGGHDLTGQGFGIVTEEKHFDAQSLEERISQVPLTPEQQRQVAIQLFTAVQHLSNTVGIFHRDIKPSNVLIMNDGQDVQVRLTDFANARKKELVDEKYLPTAGGKHVTDPAILGPFNQRKDNRYTLQSELYAAGTTLFYAISGKYPFDIDPDAQTAVSTYDGESILKTDKSIDEKLYAQKLGQSISTQIPVPFQNVIERLLSINEEERFGSVDQAVKAIRKAARPSLMARIMKLAPVIASAGIFTAIVGGSVAAGIYHAEITKKNIEHAEELKKEAKIKVIPLWDGEGVELKNNIFTMDVKVRTKNYQTIYPSPLQSIIISDGVRTTQGETLEVIVNGTEITHRFSRDASWPAFEGKVYIEGFAGEKIFLRLDSSDRTAGWGDVRGYNMHPEVKVKIPSDLPSGNYAIITEIYAPPASLNPGYSNHMLQYANFPAENAMIARKRIPLVVGDVTCPINITTVALTPYAGKYFVKRNVLEDCKEWQTYRTVSAVFEIPELEHKVVNDNNNHNMDNFWFPNENDETIPASTPENQQVYTAKIATTTAGRISGVHYFPIEKVEAFKDYRGQPVYRWQLATPTKEWSERIQAYREKDELMQQNAN